MITTVQAFLDRRGQYRRAILLRGLPGCVEAELEDNVHHFTAKVYHDGARVLRVEGGSVRIPYTTCAAGAVQMRALAGMPVTSDARSTYAFADPAHQCTHAFQLAGHAVVHAARGGEIWLFEVEIDEQGPDGAVGRVRLNGAPILRMSLEGQRVTDPPELLGMTTAQAAKRLTETGAVVGEAAVILHRAMWQAFAQRRVTHLANPVAAALSTRGNCYTFQPARAATARSLDMTRNFEREGLWPLRDEARSLRAGRAESAGG